MNLNKYMVCNEPALFSGFVFVVFNHVEGLQQSRPWILLFQSVVQQRKAGKLCRQLYTKVIRLKNMCCYYIVVILSTASSFAAFNNLRPWNDSASSVLEFAFQGQPARLMNKRAVTC